MPIPPLVPLIEPLTTRFPSAWAKSKAPHDDGEFNARVCSVLYYEKGLLNVGRNGKRGDPKDLSRDVINWKADAGETGPNPDPNGGSGWIDDFIGNHEKADAKITQQFTDPTGPGAWVKPKTLKEIDAQYGPPPPTTAAPPGREEALDEMKWLDGYYASQDGLQRPNGLSLDGKPDFEGIAAWYLDIYQRDRMKMMSRADSRADYVNQIRHSNEWKAKHPGETP